MKPLVAAIAALVMLPVAAAAQENAVETAVVGPFEQRAADVVAVMRGEMPYDQVFNAAFRAQVSQEQFLAINTQLESQFGALIGVESSDAASPTSGTMAIRFERGVANANLNIEGETPYFVNGLLLTGVDPVDDSRAALLRDLQALPGETGLLLTRLGDAEPLIAHNAETPLALGSTFKLYVLSALGRAIAAGELSWDQTVELDGASFPSGVMHDWPQGAPVTLHTLATLMISISDNTATDQLIRVLGREVVEAEVAASGHADPALMRPLMTTRELFVLKSEAGFDGAAYLALGEDERRDRLVGLADEEREMSEIMAAFSGGPNNIDVEWFASAQDVAALFARIVDLGDPVVFHIMGVNPAASEAVQSDWEYIGYKGGSEPGVLNMSWLLRDEAGAWYVTSAGWNNPDAEVQLATLNLLAMRAIALAQ